MNRFVLYIVLAALGYWLFFHESSIATVGTNGYEYPGYEISPQKPYTMQALVLGTKSYTSGREAELSRLDFALGWGPMADQRALDKIDISQRGRFYFWRVDSFREVGLSRREIEQHSANVHIIPASEAVTQKLGEVDRGDRIELRGQLVNVRAADGWRWRSSLTFDDTGKGACELLWLEELQIIEAA